MQARTSERRCWWRSLVFAALAALAAPPIVVGLGAWVGGAMPTRVALVVLAVAYAWVVAPQGTPRRRLLVLGSGLAIAVLALTETVREAAFGAALVVALLRTGVLYRAPGLRGPALELVLGALGLVLAVQWAGLGIGGLALAVWSYFLVQSAYFVVSRGGRTAGPAICGDPFEAAAARLDGLLEEMGDCGSRGPTASTSRTR